MEIEVRNAKYIDENHIRLDCEVNHPEFGWIPFTADPEDPEEFGRLVHAEAIKGEGEPYTPPPPPSPEEIRAAMPPLTRRQLRLGLLQNNISTDDIEAAIAAIEDPTERAAAQIEWEDATQYLRTHPLIEQIGAALELTPEQIDAMWMAAVEL